MIIDKITIAVAKMEQMRGFYTKAFNVNFNEIDCGDFSMWIGKLGDIQLLLCPKDIAGIKADENTIQLRFVVEDIKASFENGIASGGSILNEIQTENEILTACFRDPDGNSIELIQK